jgi:hypothetical protein
MAMLKGREKTDKRKKKRLQHNCVTNGYRNRITFPENLMIANETDETHINRPLNGNHVFFQRNQIYFVLPLLSYILPGTTHFPGVLPHLFYPQEL